jgi:hypothetical protein
MRDWIVVGPCPSGEDCIQVGHPDYHRLVHAECRALTNQLRRIHGREPGGAWLKTISQPHDFGTYYEVHCIYLQNIEEACQYAYACEDLPENWDDEARCELAGVPGYFDAVKTLKSLHYHDQGQ